MNPWLIAALVLTAGSLGPALAVSARRGPVDRLVGLELTATTSTLILLLIAHGLDQPSYLIVPLVLATLSFAGTLVFTRMLEHGA